MKIGVLGDGGWGTALAILLHNKGNQVTLWGAFPDYTAYLGRKRINKQFLPGVRIPSAIEITDDLKNAAELKDFLVLAVPSQHMRQVLKRVKNDRCVLGEAIFVSAAKGVETDSLLRMSQVIHDELGRVRLSVLSGPTIAHEVACGIPTTAVAASGDDGLRGLTASLFNTDKFRIYTNDDVIGVELGGSFKNIIAIACGIADGLGFGANTKAALLSRGLAEISRLGKSMGAKMGTFSGLSGLGDLVTTCISPYSRNRSVGEEIGKGRPLTRIRKEMQMVAEGITTVVSAYELSLKYKVDMPITREIYSVLYKNKSPLKAVRDLMTREKKQE